MKPFRRRVPVCLAVLALCFATAAAWGHTGPSADAPDPDAMRLEVTPLHHASAAAAADLIRPFLPDGSRVAADARTNQVVVLSTHAGTARAERILAALDVPDGANVARAQPPAGGRPMYDYEVRTERYGAVLDRVDVARAPGPMPFQRTLGVLLARDDDSITIAHGGADAPTRFVLPRLLLPDGEWQVRGRLTQSVGAIAVGSRVAVEWWEAEGVQYVEDVAALRRRRATTETSILGD
ncbi:hypothetical protein HN371_13735 [Candidatus Poribacteria bacterium]|jgi:hypothetical protein|nr:hypothetical protein [Candidatus Poribacteria bacterium]MBT5532917.1 hypothetical protein [Candidatus Poribacteria bacterium]MBT5710425.1 hypothetical protein [Candidatus Poribacteria bacterium]MBT7804676.1 hypothetical protein [Candidatus Poribacteria bacterium]